MSEFARVKLGDPETVGEKAIDKGIEAILTHCVEQGIDLADLVILLRLERTAGEQRQQLTATGGYGFSSAEDMIIASLAHLQEAAPSAGINMQIGKIVRPIGDPGISI